MADPYQGKTGVAKDMAVMYDMVCGSWANLLLLAIPLGFASEYMHWGPVATFSLVRHTTVQVALARHELHLMPLHDQCG